MPRPNDLPHYSVRDLLDALPTAKQWDELVAMLDGVDIAAEALGVVTGRKYVASENDEIQRDLRALAIVQRRVLGDA